MRTAIVNFFKGILVGVANIIPGVSGGTIAVVLGIFDPLIDAVNGIFKNFKKHFVFLLPLGLGAVTGIIAFSTLIEYSLTNHSFPTSMFFIGLVVGSIPLIYKKATEKEHKKQHLLATLIAILVVIAISLLKEPADPNAQTVVTAGLMIQMFLGGALASMAMIIPGISGSFVMVLLGMYPTVIHYVSVIKDYLLDITNFSLALEICAVLAPLAVGIILGIFIISKIIAILMKHAYCITYFSILGLILGSIFAIFNDPITYQSGVQTADIIVGIITLIIGFALSTLLGKE